MKYTPLDEASLMKKHLMESVLPQVTSSKQRNRALYIKDLLNHLSPEHISNKGLSHGYLEALIKCFPQCISSKFRGIHTMDSYQIAGLDERNQEWFVILNTGSEEALRNGVVGHFVLLIFIRNKFYYIDPFGRKPPLELKAQITRFKTGLAHSRRIIQSKKSAYCGMFCICFILLLLWQRIGFYKMLKLFKNNDSDSCNERRAFVYIIENVKVM